MADVTTGHVAISDCCRAFAGQVPAGGWSCEACGNGCVPEFLPVRMLPRYTGTRVAVCPDTGADLEDEGFGYWCPACKDSHPFSYVVLPGDIDDDPDREVQ